VLNKAGEAGGSDRCPHRSHLHTKPSTIVSSSRGLIL
jgi:hypothetical protein